LRIKVPFSSNSGQGDWELGQECQEIEERLQELSSLKSAVLPSAISLSFHLENFDVWFKDEISLSSKLQAVKTAFCRESKMISIFCFLLHSSALVKTGYLMHSHMRNYGNGPCHRRTGSVIHPRRWQVSKAASHI
jgi:hypothetical protein